MDCTKISSGFIGGACGDAMPKSGLSTDIVVINYDDIDRENTAAPADGVLAGITLKSGKIGYLLQTLDNSCEATATLTKGTYINTYLHQVTARIFKKSTPAKEWLNAATGARVVLIVTNRQGGEIKREVYGYEAGLKMSENSVNSTLTDGVAYAPVFASGDEQGEQESSLPLTFYAGTEATTDAAITALVTPPNVQD